MAEQCRLCLDLPQARSHFDRDHWKAIKKAAELRLAEARAEVAEADRHIRMLSGQTHAGHVDGEPGRASPPC